MCFIKINQGPNRAERRQASHHARKFEVKSQSAKRMDRPEKLEAVNNGCQKLSNFFKFA